MFFITHKNYAQVGIGTTDPKTSLDVNGALSLREGPDLILANGNSNEIQLNSEPYSFYRITGPTASFGIKRITAIHQSDVQVVTLTNFTDEAMKIRHNVGSPTNVRKIFCPNESDMTLTGKYSSVTLQYNTTIKGWIVVNSNNIEANFWELQGNTGTTPGTGTGEEFIGTADDQDVIVARNNQERLKLSSTETTQNDEGNDVDYRVESNDQENMLFVNAEKNQIFIRNTEHHVPTYIDPLNSYANSIDDGTATVGIQYAIAGWNQGTLGGGINGVIEDVTNGYAAIEGATNGAGIAMRGLSTNNSDATATSGSRPLSSHPDAIGSDLGFGGLFLNDLGFTGNIYNLSDERIKKDIITIDSAMEKIMGIKGVTFKYDYQKYNKNGIIDNKTYYGFLAQNIKEILPHAVAEKMIPTTQAKSRQKSDDMGMEKLNVVNYQAIIPVLVEAIKEQQSQIETLKIAVERLKKQ
jgi:hypothetical protein